MGCSMYHNTATGLGGGAIHLNKSFFSMHSTLISRNSAPQGGGGAIFWQGWVKSAAILCPSNSRYRANISCTSADSGSSSCQLGGCVPFTIQNASNATVANVQIHAALNCYNQSNFAQYGDCIATPYANLHVSGIPTEQNPAYPGIMFTIIVRKKDAYNQTIVSDSSSWIQIHSSLNETGGEDSRITVTGTRVVRLEQGVATFQVEIKPSFMQVLCDLGITVLQTQPSVYFDGQDAADLSSSMLSLVMAVPFSGGFGICPTGFVLIFDTSNIRMGPAQCRECGPGSYSVSPLSSQYGLSRSHDPACLNCPAGGNCVQGGSKIVFSPGELWKLDTDQYRLLQCPAGTELVNSSGASRGIYSHDAQQCKQCIMNQYILNPNTDVCQSCPPGLKCSGTDVVVPVIANSSWLRNGAVYILTSCPPGYSVSSTGALGAFDATVQQCSPCQKGEECLSERCVACAPCRPGFYKSSASADPCMPCPSDTYNTKAGAQDLSACQQCQTHASTQGRTAVTSQNGCVCDRQFYLFIKGLASFCIVCPVGATCSDGSCILRVGNASLPPCPDGNMIVGTWKLDNSTGQFMLDGCPAGYFLNSQQCQTCPASFFCTGGQVGTTPCASNQFSLPGSSMPADCFISVFVVVVINLPLSRPYFLSDQATAFGIDLARLAVISSSFVTIEVIRAGENAATTDVTARIATSDANAAQVLSTRLTSSSDTLKEMNSFAGSTRNGAVLISVQVTACLPGYELQAQPPPSICELCPTNYYCVGGGTGRVPCQDNTFSIAGANSSTFCTSFSVSVVVGLPVSMANFTSEVQSKFLRAIALSFGVPMERVAIESLMGSRRVVSALLQVNAEITANSVSQAASLGSKLDAAILNKNLRGLGVPESTFASAEVRSSNPSLLPAATRTLSTSVIAGASVGSFVFVCMCLAATYLVLAIIMKQKAYKAFVATFLRCEAGDKASAHTLPPDLAKNYIAETVLGKGSYGCVVKAE